MKKYFVVVALFCSLIFAGCSNDNLISGYEFNERTYDKSNIVGLVEFNYNQDDYYTSDGVDKVHHENVYYSVTAHFDSEDRESYSNENKVAVNSRQLIKNDVNYYQTGFTGPAFNSDFDVYLGYGKTNTVEKAESDLYPAFKHEVGFGEPVKLLNLVANQVVDKHKDLNLFWEKSSNEITDYTVHVYSYVSNGNGGLSIKYTHSINLGNVSSVVIPKKVLKRCKGTINHIEVTKNEGVFVPMEVNPDRFYKDKQYKVLYVAHSTYKTSFVLK